MFNYQDRIDLWLRVGFGALILIGCYFVIEPFMTAIVLADLLTARFGTDYLRTGGSADGQVAAAEVEKRQSIAKTGETL